MFSRRLPLVSSHHLQRLAARTSALLAPHAASDRLQGNCFLLLRLLLLLALVRATNRFRGYFCQVRWTVDIELSKDETVAPIPEILPKLATITVSRIGVDLTSLKV